MQKHWATIRKIIGLSKLILQHQATRRNGCRGIVAPSTKSESLKGLTWPSYTHRYRVPSKPFRKLRAALKHFFGRGSFTDIRDLAFRKARG
jgi:hypothetical protein